MAKENASVEIDDYSKYNDEQLIVHWHKTQQLAATWKYKEAALREEVVRRMFSNDKTAGTHKHELGKGYVLKCVMKDTYTVHAKDVEEALNEIKALGNEGEFVAKRLIKWEPKLSLTEFKECGEKIRNIIMRAITIKPAMPTLEIVEPKKK